MLAATFQSTWWVMREPRIVLLSAATTVGFGFALSAFGGTGDPLSALSAPAISAIVCLIIARSWCGLSIAATALAVLRRRREAPWLVGVGLFPALGVLVVTVPPLAPMVVGAFLTITGRAFFTLVGALLIAIGAFWVAAWSQAGMLIIDGKADVMEAGQSSVFMTRGYRGEILAIWLLGGAGVVAATWLDARVGALAGTLSFGPPIAAVVHFALRIVSDAFGTCCLAGLYYELDRAEAEH